MVIYVNKELAQTLLEIPNDQKDFYALSYSMIDSNVLQNIF